MLRPIPGHHALKMPSPPDLRRVWCPHCDNRFAVSRRAMSVRCPKCTNAVPIGDLEMKSSIAGDVNVSGEVVVPEGMEIRGKLTCAQVTVRGRVTGRAHAGGSIELDRHGQVRGEIICRSLVMVRGSSVRAIAAIGSVD